MATSATDAPSFNSLPPPHPPSPSLSQSIPAAPRPTFPSWLRHHRFHLMSLVFLSSTVVTAYRMTEQTRLYDEFEERSSELDTELNKVRRLTERRRQALQQQLHSLWASPPSAGSAAAGLSSPSSSLATTVQSSAATGGWLSWSSWKRWWQGGHSATNNSTAATATSIFAPSAALRQLPLCGSTIHVDNLSSLSRHSHSPPASYIASVVSDVDYLLHTGALPPSSPFTAAATASTATNTASSSSQRLTAASSSDTAASSTGAAAPASHAAHTTTGNVTGSGKRLMV